MEAQGHPPVQPPQAGYLPVYTPMSVITATAIAPAPSPAPHAPVGMTILGKHTHGQLVTPPAVFIDHQRYRLQRTPSGLMASAAVGTVGGR